MNRFYTTMNSPLGELVLTSDSGKGLSGIYPPGHPFYSRAKKAEKNPEPFKKAVKQLDEYFAGRRTEFDVTLESKGTEFQKRVWKELGRISFGETKSYGEIAKSLKMPKASRAVGMANSKNPVCIIVPCHRVIGANGKLTGYAGGMKAKKLLLDLESRKARF